MKEKHIIMVKDKAYTCEKCYNGDFFFVEKTLETVAYFKCSQCGTPVTAKEVENVTKRMSRYYSLGICKKIAKAIGGVSLGLEFKNLLKE